MKVVALVSGGKDSFYSMFLAAQEGHEIVAVANLCPQESEPDDLDSYMYQTVGHQMIEAYAECMGVPVFRRAIVGTSTRKELQYTQADLLSGMIDSGIDAILVKVAALGLDPHKHLGRSISQLQPYLHALNAKYGSNVCGEGGEYETLVTDCPMFK
ncbi:hypothetical protein FOA52_006783 [Chlamydomonas sp. UWO 241]|nr:hypothetical protein FOA52_006783 [Chlamydomonas sp. UWO 241]